MRRSGSAAKVIFWISVVVALAAIGVLVFRLVTNYRGANALEEAIKNQPVSQTAENPSSGTNDPETKTATVFDNEAFQTTVDFSYWRSINPDVYAYISILGTDQGYPILQNEEDNDYYLRRDLKKEYYVGGSLYTQFVYNGKEFDDPCTIIYGHHMPNGTMFGQLETMTTGRDLTDENDLANYFVVNTPNARKIYRIVAAGTFNDNHVLYYYDFTQKADFKSFFDELASYDYGVHNVPAELRPELGTKLTILSTCFQNDYNYRYLVVGALVSEEETAGS